MTDSASLASVLSRLEQWHLVVVSNRQPYRHTFENDEIVVDRPAGGLTAGLDPVVQQTDGTWVAWGDGDADREAIDDGDSVRVPPEDPAYTLKRVWLSASAVADYYYGFSNRVLWPLSHGLTAYLTFEDRHWERYREVNKQFADSVVAAIETDNTDDSSDTADPENTVVWFQDYHFGLAPQFVREAVGEEVLLSHFWHIPWPEREVFRDCPHQSELLRGLLANDLVGFHIPRYCANFLDCVATILPDASVDWEAWTVSLAGHKTRIRSFPMGVDTAGIAEHAAAPDEGFWSRFREDHGIPDDQQVAVGIDRLDYTKGIPERLAAIEQLLETEPNWRGEFTYVQKATPSRTEIPEYRELGRRVDRAIEQVNDRFGTDDWQPVVEIDDYLSEEALYGLCRHSDLAIVSPLADGMNLVAMEYVSAQIDHTGVLVLSEHAGAHDLLGDAAISIDPTDTDTFADRLDLAASMPDDERRQRMEALRSTVTETDIQSWMADVFDATLELAGSTDGADSTDSTDSTDSAETDLRSS